MRKQRYQVSVYYLPKFQKDIAVSIAEFVVNAVTMEEAITNGMQDFNSIYGDNVSRINQFSVTLVQDKPMLEVLDVTTGK